MSSEDVLKLDKPTPETERISALMKELMGRCTALVIKVATCDCPNRDNCGVFIESRKIAKVIDKTLLFRQTKELSITDELTGLYNRRYFNERFEREVQRARRYNRPLTVLMIDIDYFKNFNDINGHLMGDEILKRVAHTLEYNIRKADILARYGGEEFVIILPEIDKAHALKVAEKLRITIEKKRFPKQEYQPNKNLTISLGVASFPEDSDEAKELVDFADRALYKAKADGRNRVMVYHSSMENNKYYNTALENLNVETVLSKK